MTIEFVHGSHDAVLEFLFGFDTDMAQHRAGELGEEALDEIEPGSKYYNLVGIPEGFSKGEKPAQLPVEQSKG